MRYLLVSLLLLNMAAPLRAQSPADPFDQRPEVYFCFPHPGPERVAALSRYLSIDHGSTSDTLFAYANRKGWTRFVEEDLPFRLLTAPGLLIDLPAKDPGRSAPCLEVLDYYPTYEGYETLLYDFETAFPDLCRVEIIGVLPSGRKLLALVISDAPTVVEKEPRFLYTATIHGNETVGYSLMLRLIDYLLCNYGEDDRVTTLVDEVEIWINPLANPDGTYTNNNATLSGATRFNAAGVDLNRNFPDPEDGPNPDGEAWQPETLAFLALADTYTFDLASNLHGGAEVCNYPWDTWAQLHADDDWWRFVCRQYADTAQAHSPPGYMDYLDDGITNGYDWYTVAGGRQDFTTYFQGGREFTLELSNTKLVPSNQLGNFWEYNYRSLLNYLDQARYGLRGVVTDSITGEPLVARVWAEGHDADSSHVWSRLPHGNYYRFLKEGTYAFTFSAPGYVPKTIAGVAVEDLAATVLDVALAPESVTSAVELAGSAGIQIQNIHFSAGGLDLEWTSRGGAELQLRLYDAGGRCVGARKTAVTSGAGTLRWRLPELPAGIYFLRAETGGRWVTRKLGRW